MGKASQVKFSAILRKQKIAFILSGTIIFKECLSNSIETSVQSNMDNKVKKMDFLQTVLSQLSTSNGALKKIDLLPCTVVSLSGKVIQ